MYLTRNRQFAFLAIVGVALVGAPPVEAGSIEALLKRSFRTQGDKVLAWNDLAGAKASVVVFLSFDCPVSTSYSQLLADLARDYQTKGVSFVGFCPCDDDAGRIAAQASEHRLGFPVFKDDQFAVADALGAKTTPQVFVLDAKNDVIYTGLIDDGYVKRLVPSRKVSK